MPKNNFGGAQNLLFSGKMPLLNQQEVLIWNCEVKALPRIFDNIEQQLLPAIREGLEISTRADFCVGYFNLRGWNLIADEIESLKGGEQKCCRILVGMQSMPSDEVRDALRIRQNDFGIDNRLAALRKTEIAREFRAQLTFGMPTDRDELALRGLAEQIRLKKVLVKVYLKHLLHAKLYLLYREDKISPLFAYLGSSNLTMAGLSSQGELNVDVLEQDACEKLSNWFEDRWNDKFCIDISNELVSVIDESWAREDLIDPYHIYVKMAYHLSEDAREGLADFQIPKDIGDVLFEFQSAAVRIAAHHLNKRGGVLIGDVVGLGKTLMACALARVFQDDNGLETLIVCPKNLVPMWEDYRDRFRMVGRVLSTSKILKDISELRRFRVVLIDESQNLRNREGKRYKAIKEYIEENDSKVILLSATPYNKSYSDLSNQLRLFIPENQDLPIRPEALLREIGEVEFVRRHQCNTHSLDAFDKSSYTDDWRELMRLYLVRRTRSFIMANYAETDPDSGRKYLEFPDGRRSYFPTRKPKTVRFKIDNDNPDDQYAMLYAEGVVNAVNALNLPRYGLAAYLLDDAPEVPTEAENEVFADLSRAGRRIMGFCRTGLFKRLESSGYVFLQSLSRHILRNYIYVHALENNLPIPIGSQSADLFVDFDIDPDSEEVQPDDELEYENQSEEAESGSLIDSIIDPIEEKYRMLAAEIYCMYAGQQKRRFRWLRHTFFGPELMDDLLADAGSLLEVIRRCGAWDPRRDSKLTELTKLIQEKCKDEKVLVFSQFADTVKYLERQLKREGVSELASVTGNSGNPTAVAYRFSPKSNNKVHIADREGEIRVLLATDVLSEGQNLQDCYTIVNYDLPWAIIRLIQRVGRVDRIGQDSEVINCFSFLPAEGVERLIRLRQRVRARLRENAEVVGADEAFFEDEDDRVVVDLYNEKSGLLDGDDEGEVDLASNAYQIWKNAIDNDKNLEKIIRELPDVVFATKKHAPAQSKPAGALVYVRTENGNDMLTWVDDKGETVTESQLAILRAAECDPGTTALSRKQNHHAIVARGVEQVLTEEAVPGGQLGRSTGARYRTYQRLSEYAAREADTLFVTPELLRAIDQIYGFPLRDAARDTLNRLLRSGASDQQIAERVVQLYDENRLCLVETAECTGDPRIICSMGLSSIGGDGTNDVRP